MKDVTRYEATTEWGNAVMSEYKFGDFVTYEDYASMKEQLTATTNSLTNAQEALKSAGIEADTVQAGVMGLKAQGDGIAALAEERRQFIVNGVETGDITLPVIDADPAIVIYERCLLKPMFAHDSYLNAVRAEGIEVAANDLFEKTTVGHQMLMAFAARLRAGIAGKDGSYE
ncbi:hypothetical protein [uncultured Pantoea sp.]|uniref:hypothetical protein n=1 Tax=uncultured Pantoea sp. TaxID=218084 RepID=UPI0025852CDB|nr:hypothetical protein [uncultured Pantoea sp.]